VRVARDNQQVQPDKNIAILGDEDDSCIGYGGITALGLAAPLICPVVANTASMVNL
jgi:hypothetical protein